MAFQRKKPAAIGVKAPYPGFIEPELATSVDKVPSGTRWIPVVAPVPEAVGSKRLPVPETRPPLSTATR
jgi:hypothetical protein